MRLVICKFPHSDCQENSEKKASRPMRIFLAWQKNWPDPRPTNRDYHWKKKIKE